MNSETQRDIYMLLLNVYQNFYILEKSIPFESDFDEEMKEKYENLMIDLIVTNVMNLETILELKGIEHKDLIENDNVSITGGEVSALIMLSENITKASDQQIKMLAEMIVNGMNTRLNISLSKGVKDVYSGFNNNGNKQVKSSLTSIEVEKRKFYLNALNFFWTQTKKHIDK